MLSKDEKNMVLSRFPEINLFYNKNIYRKVYADYYSIIPKGPKAILWFTYIHKKNVCLLLHLDNKDNIKFIEKIVMCFDKKLSYGTIIYGTVIKSYKQNIFCCENIHYCKGKNIEKIKNIQKLTIFNNLFSQELSQKTYTTKSIKPVLPLMDTNYENIIKLANNVNYSVYGVKYSKNNFDIGIERIVVNQKLEGVFKVVPHINSDIYHLYCLKDMKDHFVGNAMIQTYKKSVFMNNIFRNIKENTNLDYLEESDDEEEFENIDPCKFLKTNKDIFMRCIYNNKFKKWEPIEKTLSTEKYTNFYTIKKFVLHNN